MQVRISNKVATPEQIKQWSDMGQSLALPAEFYSMMLTLSVWYSLLYAVVEGYLELGLEDEAVDDHLSQGDYLDQLRRFRNAHFHYQKDLISPKALEFLDAPGSEKWINKLNKVLDNFLSNYPPIREFLDQVRPPKRS